MDATVKTILVAAAGAVIGAIATGLVKLAINCRERNLEKKAVATAIGGELGAYLRLLQPEETVKRFRKIAEAPYDARTIALRGFFNLPSGHPVFDWMADKIGLLPPEAARGVSEAYNIITSARLMLGSLSSADFLQSPDAIQVARITAMVGIFAQEIGGMRRTVELLNQIAG